MGLFDKMLDRLAKKIGEQVQNQRKAEKSVDVDKVSSDFSVEYQACSALSAMVLQGSNIHISGDSERARAFDNAITDFCSYSLGNAVLGAFLLGDSIVIPLWDGSRFINDVVTGDRFSVLSSNGQNITGVLYVVDEKTIDKKTYYLLRSVIYENGVNTYRTWVALDGDIVDNWRSMFTDWSIANVDEWSVSCEKPLFARLRSHVIDPTNPDALRGTPICFSAKKPISELHYLFDQLHNEFELSEKMVIVNPDFVQEDFIKDASGNIVGRRPSMAQGRNRLFYGGTDDKPTVWAPSINFEAYSKAIDFQYQEVERCIGISSGVLSSLASSGVYANTDSIRRANMKTNSFISSAQKNVESLFSELVYCWAVLSDIYKITPYSDEYYVNINWNNDLINSYAEQRLAIYDGVSIGATSALDYRMLVLNETMQQAQEAKGQSSIRVARES